MPAYNFAENADRDSAGHTLRFIFQHWFTDPWKIARNFTFAARFVKVKTAGRINLEEHQTLMALGQEIIDQINNLYPIHDTFCESTVQYLSDDDEDDADCFGETYTLVLNEEKTIVYLGIYPHHISMSVRSVDTFPKHLLSIVEFIRTKEIPVPHKAAIHIIKKSNYGFDATKKTIKKKADFSPDHYNDDFGPVADRIQSTINSDTNRGIVLLHGGIGTGKTSYIKHIMQVSKKKVYYVPPDLAHNLSDPGLIEFITGRLQDSVLVIEDAENVLRSREAGGSQAVSNILNISDGILGEVMSSTIIATVNCPLKELDQALMRPGRLIAEYEFRALTQAKTNYLLRKLYGEDQTSDKALTLAEIFNINSMPATGPKVEKVKLGFA
jgi:hypothetical protein